MMKAEMASEMIRSRNHTTNTGRLREGGVADAATASWLEIGVRGVPKSDIEFHCSTKQQLRGRFPSPNTEYKGRITSCHHPSS